MDIQASCEAPLLVNDPLSFHAAAAARSIKSSSSRAQGSTTERGMLQEQIEGDI